MAPPVVLHVVDPDHTERAQLARIAFALGHHAEVYAGLGELADHHPDRGLLLMREGVSGGDAAHTIARLTEAEIWLPLIVTAVAPRMERVVAAIKAGALDYLALPATAQRLREVLQRTDGEACAHAEARRELIEARRRIGALTRREREVLDALTEGCSNKAIARALAISPRTVEIHRANMMSKLGASHPADAVRVRLAAGD